MENPFFNLHLSDILLDSKTTFFLSEKLIKVENIIIEKPYNVKNSAILKPFHQKLDHSQNSTDLKEETNKN